jgi:hypothetical protein
MTSYRLAIESSRRCTAYRQFALLSFAVALAGCRSGEFSCYVSPRVTGRVLAADTHQPLAEVQIRRVMPYQRGNGDEPEKGGQIMENSWSLATRPDGTFVVDSERDIGLIHRDWYSLTLSFAHEGYQLLQTNYTVANVSGQTPAGAPLVEAGDILLQPVTK